MVVSFDRSYHVYWKLSSRYACNDLQSLVIKMQDILCADSTSVEVTKIVPVVDTYVDEKGCELEYFEDTVYDLHDLISVLEKRESHVVSNEDEISDDGIDN